MDVDGGALVFREKGERIGTVPIAPLSRIFLRGSVGLKANVLSKLGESGIGVVVLSGHRSTPTLLMPQPHGDASRRIAQYRAFSSAERQLMYSKKVIEMKLTAQRCYLQELMDSESTHQTAIAAQAEQISHLISLVGTAADKQTLLGLRCRLFFCF